MTIDSNQLTALIDSVIQTTVYSMLAVYVVGNLITPFLVFYIDKYLKNKK